MAGSGHLVTMKVTISELRASLGALLDRVRRGQKLTVLDRHTPIARIVPLAADGLIIEPASEPVSALKTVKGVEPLEPFDVQAVLADLRGDR